MNELVAKIFPEDELAEIGVDKMRRKLIKSRRHKLRKRLVEPYKEGVRNS